MRVRYSCAEECLLVGKIERVWLVCGSRSLTERMWVLVVANERGDRIGQYLRAGDWISEVCREYLREGDVVIHGDAVGVDRLAACVAREIGCALTVELPKYAEHGKQAPLIRDKVMLDRLARARDLGYETNVLALWDGVSNGTRYTVQNAKQMGWAPIVAQVELVVAEQKLLLL